MFVLCTRHEDERVRNTLSLSDLNVCEIYTLFGTRTEHVVHRVVSYFKPMQFGRTFSSPALSGRLRANITSSREPEVHNVLQRRQRRIESWPQATFTENMFNISRVIPETCRVPIDRQTCSSP